MDPLTHAVCGATLAAVVARKVDIRMAAALGAAAGLAPDLDIFIRSAADPLVQLHFHRHFTHALAFVPVGALLCAVIGWTFLRSKLSFGRLYLYCFMGYLQGGLLDACTSYGTRLWWPFSDERVAWSNVAIIDPLFTGGLLILLILALTLRRRVLSIIGLAFALLYLGFGIIQRDRAEAIGYRIADKRGDEVLRLEAKPAIFSNALFRVVYETPTHYQADAVRTGWFGSEQIYAGEIADKFDERALLPHLNPDSTLARGIARFDVFSAGWLSTHPGYPNVVGDFRYALFPNSGEPLWGIVIDPQLPDDHVKFEPFRNVQDGDLDNYWRMIRGRPLFDDPLQQGHKSIGHP